MKQIAAVILVMLSFIDAKAQTEQINKEKDSLYIEEVENKLKPDKVLHAEPLFIDLIRDLGARKGEREWNLGLGLTDNNRGDKYTALVEYEWAPINRLGLEVELPFTFYPMSNGNMLQQGSKLNSLKFAAQYSFYVSEKNKTSMALGYIHEFELTAFKNYRTEQLFTGNIYSPFFIAAKRWGDNYHTLIYTGPSFIQHRSEQSTTVQWQINSNFHYLIPGTRNFIGMEANKRINKGDFDIILRPQMRVGIAENLLVGIVTGIPLKRYNERLSSFIRLIYEPGMKKHG